MHNCLLFWNQFLLKSNFDTVNKKIQSPHSSTQRCMHAHKHTGDLDTGRLCDSPALCACGGRAQGSLCSSACAGRKAFLKPSCRGNCWCWCGAWNTTTNQIILSSTKGATKGKRHFYRGCVWMCSLHSLRYHTIAHSRKQTVFLIRPPAPAPRVDLQLAKV